jgi:uncharacterized integral membrane protein
LLLLLLLFIVIVVVVVIVVVAIPSWNWSYAPGLGKTVFKQLVVGHLSYQTKDCLNMFKQLLCPTLLCTVSVLSEVTNC